MTRDDGAGHVSRTALDCAGADRAVCARVVRILPDLAPKPGEVCTQIYGGPQRIVVEGVVAGRAVRAEVTRADGCQIARYDRLIAALGA